MRQWMGVGVALLLALGACSSAEDASTTLAAATTTPDSTTTTAEAPTTTVAETTTSQAPSTTVGPAEPPLPDTSGDDWTRIVSELIEFGGWLFENPDPSLLEYLADPDSEYGRQFGGVIAEYEENGWHDLPGGRTRLVEVTPQGVDTTVAIMLIVDDYDGAVTVDANGVVVKEDPDQPPSASLMTLHKDREGRWRITDSTPLGPVEGVDE